MLLMSHFDKTVIKIIITTKGSPTDTWIKNLILWKLKTVKWVLIISGPCLGPGGKQ